MSWTMKITRVGNGYIIEYGDERTVEVFEEKWGDWTKVECQVNADAAVALAYEMWDYFNLRGSKYDKARPFAGIEQGHGYIDPDKKEEDIDDD